MSGESGSLTRQSYLDQLREGIRGLALYVVVGEGDEARDVRNRNRMDRPRLLDAVLLDDLWDLIEQLGGVADDE